ncbi:unnamed protein product [Lampetra planeri]
MPRRRTQRAASNANSSSGGASESYARDEQKPTTAAARAVSVGDGHASLVHGPQVKQRFQQQQGERLSQPCHGITLEKKRHIISLLPDTAWVASSVVDKHKRLSQRLCREREQRWESPSDVAPHASPPDTGARTRREDPEVKSAKSGTSRCAPGETLSDKENDALLPAAADGRRGRAWEGSGAGSVPTGDQINVGKRFKVPFNVLTSQQDAINGRRETVSMVCSGNAFPSAPHSCGARDCLLTSPAKLDLADGSLHELSSSLPMPEPSGGSPLLSRHRVRSRSVSLPLKADSKVQDLPGFAGRQNSLNIREFTVEDGRAISRAASTSGPALDEVYRGEHEFPGGAGGSKATRRRVEDACLCHYAALDKDAFAHSRGNGPAAAEASCGQKDAVTTRWPLFHTERLILQWNRQSSGAVASGIPARCCGIGISSSSSAPEACSPDERGIHIVAFKEKQRQLRDWHALHHNPVADKPVQANLLDVQKRSNRVSAVVKGFLTRRLLRTEKVQRLVRVIKGCKVKMSTVEWETSLADITRDPWDLHWAAAVSFCLQFESVAVPLPSPGMSVSRVEVLGLYRRVFRLARGWRSQGAAEPSAALAEAEYIRAEARALFRKNKDLVEPEKIKFCIEECKTRIELALHYKIPYPRPMNLPPMGLAGKQGRQLKTQERLRKQAKPIYLQSHDET